MPPDVSDVRCEVTLNTADSCASELESGHYHPQQYTNENVYPDAEETSSTSCQGTQHAGAWAQLQDRSLRAARKDRRGLLPHLAVIPEFKDARDYPASIKKFVVFVIAFSSMMGPMATSIIFPSINPIMEDYKCSSIMVNVSVGVYQISLGVFPLWWSSISEMNGRRTVYIISFILLVAFNVGAAVSPSIQDFIILRVCSGGAAASVQSVGAGTVSDLYIPEQRGRNLGIYYMGPLMAPLISPIIGAALVSRWSWRSTQWFMVVLSAVNVMVLVLFLPETLRKQDNEAAILAILKERRRKSSATNEKQETGIDKEPDAESGYYETQNPSVAESSVVSHEEIENGSLELRRALSQSSNNVNNFMLNNDLDMNAPQISRIQSHDPRQEQMLREYEIRRMQSNMKDELARIETKRSKNSSHSMIDKKSSWQSFRHIFYLYLLRPLKSVYFLQYPPVLMAITFSAISFAILYFVNMTLQYGYSHAPYNFSPMLVGLMYIPNSVTYFLASVFGGKWTDHLLMKYKAKHGILAPEARISWNLFTAVVAYPISLIIFGWCLDKGEHWETPLVGTALFGFASMMTIGATVAYLVDSLPGKGATGVALNNLVRQLLAGAAVFVNEDMIIGMGIGWAFTMLAFIIVGASVVLLILKRHGDYWRENYDLERLYKKLE